MPREVDYVPPVSRNDSENLLRDPNVSFKVNPDRSKLFNKKRIIFLDNKQFDQNSASCKLAGADTILWTGEMECTAITSKDIVIKPTSVSNKEMWTKVTSHLTSLSMAPCPHTDLYLAIVHCSTEHYCNPTRRSQLISGVSDVTDGNKMSHKVLAPDTCSVSGTPLSGSGGSRVHISETLSNSTNTSDPGAKQIRVPFMGETQVLETSSRQKRPRSSEEEEDSGKPPAKVSNIDKSLSEDASGRRSPADMFSTNNDEDAPSNNNFKTPGNLFSNNISSGKENIMNNSNKMSSKVKESDEEEDDDEDDLFGFGCNKLKKKRDLPTPDKTQSGTQKKRPKMDENSDDDLFGFDDDELKREPQEPENDNEESVKLKDTCPPSKNKAKHQTNEEYFENSASSSSRDNSKQTILSSTGFIGRMDIKKEVKDETHGDNEMSSLSVTVAKISLLRPSSSKPRYVGHPDPNKLGKPVKNYKKFKKQQIEKPRTMIALKKYVPDDDNNQTRIENWFEDNVEVTQKEHEKEQNAKKDDDFWDFENSQADKNQKKNPFSRTKR